MLLMALIKIFGGYLMKKLVSVLGSIVMGVNVGAVSSNAVVTTEKVCNMKELEASEVCGGVSKYYENSGWREIATDNSKNSITLMCLKKSVDLLGNTGVLRFGSKNQLDNLIIAVQEGLMGTCYYIVIVSKNKFYNIFKTKCYKLLENEGNVKLVEKYLPQFTSNLDIYLNTKDSKEKNE